MATKTALVTFDRTARQAFVRAKTGGDIIHATYGASYQEAIGFAILWAVGAGGFDRVTVTEKKWD